MAPNEFPSEPDELTADEELVLKLESEVNMDQVPGRRIDIDLGGRKPRHVFSLKLSAEELDEIAEAAEAAGVSTGAFIRAAALDKARGQDWASLARVRAKAEELAEAVKKLHSV